MNALLTLTLVIGIIWFVPLLCRKIHVPSIVGFILAGIVIGPSVLDLVGETPALQILGSLGMLYIMFQSGSEMDINDFKQYKYRSLFFGLCTFFIPFALGLIKAAEIIEDGRIDSFIKDKYASFNEGIGEKILSGEATLEELSAYACEKKITTCCGENLAELLAVLIHGGDLRLGVQSVDLVGNGFVSAVTGKLPLT